MLDSVNTEINSMSLLAFYTASHIFAMANAINRKTRFHSLAATCSSSPEHDNSFIEENKPSASTLVNWQFALRTAESA